MSVVDQKDMYDLYSYTSQIYQGNIYCHWWTRDEKNPDPLSIGAIRRKRTMSGDLVPNQKELEGPFALVIDPLYITPGKW